MATKKKGLTLEQLQTRVAEEARQSIAYLGGRIAEQRSLALQYYFREPVGDLAITDENRSKVISSDVADTVEWILPSLLRIFTAGDDVVRFEPQGPEDEAAAKQATEYCNWIFNRDNPGFVIFYTVFKDALLQKNGIGKVWWEVKETDETRTVYGIDDDAYTLLVSDPDIEILAHTQTPIAGSPPPAGDAAVEPAMPIPQAPAATYTHDVEYRKRTEKGKVCIEAIPPENFLIARDAKDIASAAFVAHRERRTRSDLIAEGYDKEQVMALPSEDSQDFDEEAEVRRDTDEADNMPVDRPGAMAEVWITEAYPLIDFDGDGIAERRKIVCGGPGYEILKKNGKPDNEKWEGPPPFWSVTPIIQPHKWIGVSVADLTMMYQNIKTALLRGTLDNLYLTNNPRNVVSDQVNLDDYMDGRAGGAIRLTQGAKPSDGHVMPLVVPFVAEKSFAMLEVLDGMKENAVGVTRYNQGIDANSLNKTASGISQIMSASQQRIELIARIFAETGVKDLFKLILHCVSKYQDKPRMIRLRGEWVPMDPNEWDSEFDMSINVGLGTGNKDQMLAHLMTILQMQTQAVQMQQGIQGPLVTGENLYNTASKIVENSGLKSPELYFTDPKNAQAQPHQERPDPELIKIQQDGAFKQKELELKAFQTTKELELKQASLQADVALKVQDQQASHAMKQESFMADQAFKKDTLAASQKPTTTVQFNAEQQLQGVADAMTQIAQSQEQTSQMMAQAMQAVAQAAQVMAQAAQTMSAPKRVVRGADGRVEGVEAVLQ